MHPYERLEVWKRARALTVDVYRITRTFPRDEAFGLTAQLRRAAISVGANIVEGSKRRTGRDFAHFLNVSEGSAAEVAYLLLVSTDLGYGPDGTIRRLATECGELQRMLCSLRKHVAAQ